MEHFVYVTINENMILMKLSAIPEEYGLNTDNPTAKIRGYIGEECTPIYQITDMEGIGDTLSTSNLRDSPIAIFQDGGEVLTFDYSPVDNNVSSVRNELNIDYTGSQDVVSPRDNEFYSFSYNEIRVAMNQALENQAQDETPQSPCSLFLAQNDIQLTNTGMKNS